MFCSGCGKEITEGSKFCPGCGKATDGGMPNVTNVASDPTKILKEGDFLRMEKGGFLGLGMVYESKLTLFCDRLECNGKKVNEIIKLDDIVKLSVGHLAVEGADSTLEITDRAGKTRIFYKKRMIVVRAATRAVEFDRALVEIESWRVAIDKLRGRLLDIGNARVTLFLRRLIWLNAVCVDEIKMAIPGFAGRL